MYGNLKLQLWKSGIRQNQLAQMLNIDDTLLSKIVNGFRRPSPELRARISKVLDCEEAWLFEESRRAARTAPEPVPMPAPPAETAAMPAPPAE